jgi:hypothetical protein
LDFEEIAHFVSYNRLVACCKDSQGNARTLGRLHLTGGLTAFKSFGLARCAGPCRTHCVPGGTQWARHKGGQPNYLKLEHHCPVKIKKTSCPEKFYD